MARRAVTLAGADGCGIFEYSPERARFHAVVSQGISRHFVASIPVAMNQGTLGRATRTGEPVQVADVQAVPELSVPGSLRWRKACARCSRCR